MEWEQLEFNFDGWEQLCFDEKLFNEFLESSAEGETNDVELEIPRVR